MSSFAPSAKRAKTDGKSVAEEYPEGCEFWKGIPKIEYEGPDSDKVLAYKYYQPDQMVAGKKMKDWLRFSVCYWHSFRGTGADPFGFPTQIRPWDDGSNTVENALRRVRAAFEFFQKLGVEYYTFHDRDVAPEGETIEESNANLDKVADLLEEMQKKTGIQLLWGTANLFSNSRYMNGGLTNPDLHGFAYAGAQVKKAMEVTHRLGGENYVFWGGREGFQCILNTEPKKEMDHMAAMFHMCIKHKKKLGANFQFLIEPKPREPTKHQYDYDTQTVHGFLLNYGLDKDFKVNIEPNHTTLAGHNFEHDVVIAQKLGILGSIDSNTGDPLLGWDTDQFPMNVKECTHIMNAIMEQGGLAPGGLNFDCKLRRESTDLQDLFIGHIGAMDCFAKALLCAAKMREDGKIAAMVKERYSSWDKPLGKKVEQGKASLEDLHAMIAKEGEVPVTSGQQELYEMLHNKYV